MNELMKDLRREHYGLRRLLALLEAKLHMLEQDIPPKYSLIADTIDYIESYIERYHHPKEDIIYQYIIDNDLDRTKDIANIMKDHKTISQTTKPLKATLDAILLDIIVPKETTIEQLRAFIQTEQAHVELEDNLIFPMVESLIDDKGWKIIAQSVPKQDEDPLFGERVRAEYQDLFIRLKEINSN
ncbi:hemerythrin domain-containing protein [Colwelliaceae bacterium 6471]